MINKILAQQFVDEMNLRGTPSVLFDDTPLHGWHMVTCYLAEDEEESLSVTFNYHYALSGSAIFNTELGTVRVVDLVQIHYGHPEFLEALCAAIKHRLRAIA
jgi:hypothetical protein